MSCETKTTQRGHELSINEAISDNQIDALAKSLPNLKVIRIEYSFVLGVLNAIMKSFNFVEVLKYRKRSNEYDHFNEINELIQGDCSNPKLIELDVEYTIAEETPFVEKFFVDYPNLRKLKLNLSTSTQFRQILNDFTRLETLELYYAFMLTIDDLHYLADHKNNLKCVSLKKILVELTPELEERLSTSFDVVEYRNDKLSMADYRNVWERGLWE